MRKILKELGSHSLTYLVGNIAISASSILLLPLYTRYLSKADYGILEILDSLNSVLLIVFTSGLGAAYGKFYSEAASDSEKKTLFGTSFWFVASFSTCCIAVLALFRPQLAHALLGSYELSGLITIGLIIMWSNPIYIVGTYYLNVNKMPKTFLVFSIAKLIVNILFNVFFIVHLSYGVKGMMLGELLSTGIVGIFMFALIVYKNGLPFEAALLRKSLVFGLPIVFSMLCAALMHRTDRYLLQKFTSLEAVGIYGLGYKLPFMLGSLLLTSFGRIWNSSAQFEIARQENWQKIFSRVTTYFFIVVVLCEFTLAILSTTILKVLTAPAYYAAAPVIQILAVGVTVYSLHNFFIVPALIKNKTWYLPISFLAAAVLTVALDYVLLPRFGYMAAAWVMVTAYAVFSATIYLTLNRFYSVPYEFGRMGSLFVIGIALILLNNATMLPGQTVEILKQMGLACVLPAFILFGPFLKEDELREAVAFSARFSPSLSRWYARRRRVPLPEI